MTPPDLLLRLLSVALSEPTPALDPAVYQGEVVGPARRLRALATGAPAPDGEAPYEHGFRLAVQILAAKGLSVSEIEERVGALRAPAIASPALRRPLAAKLTLRELLATGGAGAPAIVGIAGSALSYAELSAALARVEQALRTRGLGRADRVAIVHSDGPTLAVLLLGTLSTCVAAPLNPAYRAGELAFSLEDFGVRAVIVEPGLDTPVREVARARGIQVIEGGPALGLRSSEAAPAPEPGHPDDLAMVLHTSGTTARPKVVPLTHSNLCTTALNIAARLALGPDDRCLNPMPMFHVHGILNALISSLAAGGSVVCAPGFLAPEFFGWVAATRPTWFTAVPTIHQSILHHARAHQSTIERSALRFVRSSSAHLPGPVLAEMERTYRVPVIESYGMTEVDQIACHPLPPAPRKSGSVGPAGGPELAIWGPDGEPRAPGERGEVVVRGPNVMSGYQSPPGANEQAFAGGWFHTGDQGYLDADGYLFLTGRLKEIINRGGEKISPPEVEEVLLQHPAIDQAIVGPEPHAELGEVVLAGVVMRPGQAANELELRAFVVERLADFKVPHRIVFLDAIPRGPTGKPQRLQLAASLASAPTPAAPAATGDLLEEKLRAIWEQVLDVRPIAVDQEFVALGGTSLLARHLLAAIEAAFGAPLPGRVILEAATVVQLAASLRRLGWPYDAAPPAS